MDLMYKHKNLIFKYKIMHQLYLKQSKAKFKIQLLISSIPLYLIHNHLLMKMEITLLILYKDCYLTGFNSLLFKDSFLGLQHNY